MSTEPLYDNFSYSNNVDGIIYATPNLKPNAISLRLDSDTEMLRVEPNGFYVRGVKVPQDEKEALAVYNAFKQWMMWSNLTR